MKKIIDIVNDKTTVFAELQEKNFLSLQKRVKKIIKKKSKDKEAIKNLLDQLLDVKHWLGDKVSDDFSLLNNYYKTFDKDDSLNYEKIYNKSKKELL